MSELPTHPPPPYPPPQPPQQRRPAGRRRLLAVVVAAGLAVLLVGTALALPLVLTNERVDQVGRTGPVNLAEVERYDDLEPGHTTDDVAYPQSPPVGGLHDPVWLACGAYDEPVRDENAVHDLEHGTLWITYRPDLPADDVAALEDALPQNGILSPYDGLDLPVVVTVWGRQLALTGADDPRLPLFVDAFGGGETAPEPFASCVGGVRSPAGDPGTSV